MQRDDITISEHPVAGKNPQGGVGFPTGEATSRPKPVRGARRSLVLAGTIAALLAAPTLQAASLTWDANGVGALQTDGAGVWLTANQWWSGSSNATWTTGDDAIFGNGGAGGAVTLASPTTLNSLTLNSFTGTYTLGTAGQTITLTNGLTMNAGAGAVTIVSPITLGGAQSWINNSSSLLTIGTGAVTNGGNLLTVGGSANTTISSVIGGAGGLTKTGSGTLTLSGANTFGGQLSVQNGTLSIASINNVSANGTLGNSDVNVPVILGSGGQTGTLQYTGATATSTKAFTLASGGTGAFDVTVGANTLTLSNVISGSGGLTKIGAGTLTLSSNANQFTGNTVISNGKLKLGAQYSLWQSAYDTTGSTGAIGLDATGQVAPVLGGLAGGVDLATAVTAYGSITGLTLNPQAGSSVSYSGVIANGAAGMTLTKTGGGTQTLTNTNTYSGATNIYAGTLALSGASGTAQNSAFTVLAGTLLLDNTAALANRLNDATALSLGSLYLKANVGGGIQSETVGATTFAVGGKVTVDLNGGTDQTTLAMGAVTRNAGAAIDFVGTGGTLGSGASNPNVTAASGLTNTNGILDWATVGGTQWAENNSNSIRAYSGSFSAINSSTNAQNAQVSGSDTLSGARVGNSLNLIATATGQSLALGANNLTLGSAAGSAAAILKSGSDAYTISGTGQVRAGSAGTGTELIAHVDGGALTISAPLSTSIVGIAKGGTGDLILSGTRAGTMTGAIGIAGGQLEFRGASTTISGSVSGPGGITVNLNAGQTLLYNTTNMRYSGPTIVKGGILSIGSGYTQMGNFSGVPGASLATQGQGLLSNLELNGGSVTVGYYMSEFLGSGPGQIQLTGGTSGFSNSQGDASGNMWTINNDASYEVVWGSPFFKPDALLLGAAGATHTQVFTIPNRFDLNGTTRTIATDVAAFGGALSGVIRSSSGTAGITKTGIGPLSLSGLNTFNGPVTINGGTLIANTLANGGSASSLGASTSDASNLVISSGTLRYTGGAASTNRQFTISSTGTLDASGSGAINFTNTGAVAYGTVDQARTLTLTGTNTGNNTLASNIADNGTGAVSVTKTGTGLWVLSGNSSYTGPTTLNAGTLSVSAASNLGNAASNLVFNGGTLQITGTGLTSLSGLGRTIVFTSGQTVGLDINNASNTFTADQVLNQGAGGLMKAGAGTLALNQANTYTGQTTVSAGTLRLDDGGAISATPLYLNGGTFAVNRSGTATQGTDFPTVIGGTGSLANTGSGTMVLNAPTYHTGTTKATAGTITLSHALAIQNSALDTTGAGTVTLNGITTPTIGGLSGASGNLASVISSGYGSVTALTLNPTSGSVTYGGVIADGSLGMSLTKTGAGTQTLTNANTYSGATYVNAGTLTLSGSGNINSSSGIVIQGGALTSTSTTTATTPFGANNIDVKHGTLSLVPASAGAYAFTGANASAGSTFTYSGGANLVLTRNGANTLSYTIGNAGAAADSVLVRSGNGTLVIAPTALANMGGSAAGSENFIINQQTTASNMNGASTATGIYSASAVGMASNVGTFLSYGTGAGGLSAGFAQATYTVPTNASTIGANSISDVTSSIAINDLSNPYALRVGAFTLTNSGTTTVNGGAASATNSGLGGVILNSTATASTITGGTLAFGSSEGVIFAASSGAGNGTIASQITGTAGITKFGPGTLVLSSVTSNFTGGVRINQGTLSIAADTNLGNTGNSITFNGNATLQHTNTVNIGSRPITVNNGALASLVSSVNNLNFTSSGAVTGNGGLYVNSGTLGNQITFSLLATGDGVTTGNTLTGPISVGNGSGNLGVTLIMASLADSANPIVLNSSFGSQGGGWTYGSGATTALTLNNRQFQLGSAAATGTNTINNASTKNLTINTDIGFVGTGARGFALARTGSGTSTFAGRLTDNAGGALSLAINGIWNLSGTNTYSGATSLGATAATFQGLQALSPNTSFTVAHGSALNLLDDGTGTLNRQGVNFTLSYSNIFGTSTIFVGNNNTANGGTSSGTTTGSTYAIGDWTVAGNGSDDTLNIQGANGYRLSINNVNLRATGSTYNAVFTPTTAPVTINGTIIQNSGNPSGFIATLKLDGTAAGNLISGSIKDAADFTNLSNANARALNLTKSSTGTWTLSGANTYTGVTTLSGGTLNLGVAENVNVSGPLGKQLANAAGSIVLSGGTLQHSAANTNDYSGRFSTAASQQYRVDTNGQAVTWATALTSSGGLLTKSGAGTLTLSGANTYSGATTVNAGTLQLDMTGSGALASTSALTLGGGNFSVKGGATSAQTLGALTLTAGTNNTITLDPNNGTSTTLTLGNAWTRGAGSSLLIDYSSSNTGTRQVQTAAATTGVVLSNGIYGGILVKDSSGVTGFATRAAGANQTITRFDDTTGTTLVNNSNVATGNFTTLNTVYTSGTLNWSNAITNRSVNSLTIDTTNSGGTIDMGVSTNVLTLTSGGILFKGTNDETLQGGQVGAAASEVIVHQTGTGAFTLNSLISSGAGSLTKDGTGTLTVGGNNTFSGAVNVNAGVLRLAHANATGTSAGGLNVQNGAAVELTGGNTFVGDALALTGTGISNGALRNTAGTNTYQGTITIGSGGARINCDASGGLTLTGGVVTSLFNDVTFGGAGNTTLTTTAITGAGRLLKDGAGTLSLNFANSYTGGTVLNGGTTSFVTNGLSSSGNITFAGDSTLQWGTSNTQDISSRMVMSNGVLSTLDTNSNNVSFASAIGNVTTGALTKIGSGTLTLNGSNTYTGLTTVTAGTLAYGTNNVIATGGVTVNGATAILDLGANRTDTVGTVTVDGGGSITGTGTSTLTSTGSFEMKNGSVSAILAGTGIALNKTTTGTVTLTGANTYSGATTITAGILNANSSAALGDSSATNTLVFNGGTLQAGGTITSASTRLVTLSSTGTIDTNSNSVSIAGVISGSGSFTKSGAGTLTLTGSNSYSGATTLGAGTLNANATAALGDSSATNTLIFNGGTLQAGGTITSASTRLVTLASTGTIDTNSNSVSIAGVISGTGGFTKSGAGTLTLTGSNSYSGATTVSNGVLNLQNATALGTTAAGTSVSSGAALQIQGDLTIGAEALALAGTGISNDGALRNISGANTYGGLITFTAATRIQADAGTLTLSNTGTLTGAAYDLTVGGAGDTLIAGIIGTTSGALTKDGAGRLTLTGANTYSGATTVSNGVLNLQNATALGTTAAGTSVSSGAALQIQGDLTIGAEALALAGTGISNDGALRNVSGANTYGGLITFTAATRIQADAGTLTLSNTGTITGSGYDLTVGGAGNTTIASVLGTGSGALFKEGGGTLTVNGVNTYTGGTTLNAGVVVFTTGGLGSSGAVTFAGDATLRYGASTTTDLSARLALNNNVTGTVDTGANDVTFASAFGASGSGALTKAGTGTLTLAGANTYTGATTVTAGALNIQNATALGATSTGTNVVSGAALQIQGDITVGAEALTLAGTGISNDGALRNISGANTFGGLITLTAAGRINSDAGTLTLSHTGTITGAGYGLTVGGAGDTVIAGIIGTTSGTLTKEGGGKLTLTGVNSYTGTTTISAGTLQVGDGTTDGSILTTSGITNNAALVYQSVGNQTSAVNITGTGTLTKSGGGTLTLTGANDYTGITAVNAGTLAFNAAAALSATSLVQVAGGATLSYTGAAATVDRDISITSGTGTLLNTGGGTLTLAGTLTKDGTTLSFAQGVFDITGSIVGASANSDLVVDGATVTLSHANTYNGPTYIRNGGILNANVAGALPTATRTNLYIDSTGTGSSQLNLGTNQVAASLSGAATSMVDLGSHTFTVGTSAGASTYAGGISGSGALVKDGVSTWTLTGANSYDGTTTVSGGVLNVRNATGLGSAAAGTIVSTGAALQLQGDIIIAAETLSLAGGGISNDGALRNNSGDNTFGGLLTLTAAARINADAGTLTLSNTGTITGATFGLSVGGSGNTVIASVIGTGTGTLTKDGTGTLTLLAANTFTGTTTVSGGALVLGDGTSTNGSVAGNIVNNAAVTFANPNALSYSGSISGTGAVTKYGAGTLTWSGTHSYSGATAVNQGTLVLGGGGLGATDVTVGSGATPTATAGNATLKIAGNYTLGTTSAGSLTISGGNTGGTPIGQGTLSLVDGALNTLTLGNTTNGATNLTLAGIVGNKSLVQLEIGDTGTDKIVVGQKLVLNAGGAVISLSQLTGTTLADNTYDLFTYSNASVLTGTFAFAGGATQIAVGGGRVFTLQNTGTATQLVVQTVTSPNNAYWKGTQDSSWSTLASGLYSNWVNGAAGSDAMQVPSSSTNVYFTANAAANFSNTTLDADFTINSLNFTGTGTSATGAVGISGNTLTLNAAAVNGNVAGSGITVAGGSGAHVISSSIVLGADQDWGNFSANTLTLSGAISGAAHLNLNGKFTFSGAAANTYSGDTTVNGGTLLLAKTAGVDAVAGNLNVAGGTVQLGASNQIKNTAALTVSGGTLALGAYDETLDAVTLTAGDINGTTGVLTGSSYDLQSGSVSAILAGTAALTKSTVGTVTLSGANTYTGGTTVTAGTLSLGAAAALAGSGAVTVNGGTLAIGGNDQTVDAVTLHSGSITGTTGVLTGTSYTVESGAISAILGGTGALTKSTAGTVTLTGVNTFTGGTTVSAGTLSLGAANALAGTGAVTVDGGTLAIGSNDQGVGAVRLDSGSITGSTGVLTGTSYDVRGGSISAILDGTAALTKSTSGTVTLTGANTYTGGTTVSAGTLDLAVANALAATGTVSVQGGTLSLTSFDQVVGAVTLSSGSITGTSGLMTADSYDVRSGAISAILAGTGALTKTTTGTVTLTGANTYSGGTDIGAGTLNFTTGGLGASGAITFSGDATLQYGSSTTTDLSARLVINNGVTGTIDTGANDVAYGTGFGASGSGALTKTGSGTLTLTASNSYTGVTTLSAGTLQLGDRTTNNGSVAGDIVNAATLIFANPNAQTYAGAISGTGNVTKTGAGMLTWTGGHTYSGATSVDLGTLTLSSGSLGGTDVTVGSGATPTASAGHATLLVAGNYTLGTATAGSLTISGGSTGGTPIGQGTLSLVDTTLNQLTLANNTGGATNLTLGGSAGNAARLNLELGNAGTDKVVMGQNLLLNAGGAVVSVSQLTGTSIADATYDLITFGAGSTLTGAFTFAGGATTIAAGGGRTFTLQTTATAAQLVVQTVASANNAYWSGAVDGSWGTITGTNATNWLDGTAGSDPQQVPGSSTNVFFTATSALRFSSTTLDTDYTINSLNFTGTGSSATGSVGISGHTITLNAAAVNGNLAGSGLTVESGSGAHTISSNLALGADQDWRNLSTNTLTLNGVLSGAHTLDLDGKFTFGGTSANTNSGVTTVNGGTLVLAKTAGIDALGGELAVTGGTAQWAANQQLGDSAALTVSGGTAAIGSYNETVGTVTLSGGNITGTTGVLTGGSYDVQSGAISAILAGSGTLTKNTTGTVTLTGANTYSGGTDIGAGTLNFTTGGLGASGDITFSGNATLQYGTGTTTDLSSRLALSNGKTATIDTGANTVTFATGIGASGTGALDKDGSGTLILTGANTYSGGTTISAGTLQLGSGGTTGSLAAGTNIVNNAALVVNRSNAFSLSNVISGTGTLTQSGSGTTTLTATNTYTGTTSITAGQLNVTGSTAAGSAVTVSGGALGGSGTVGGTVTLTATGGIDLTDGVVGTFALGSTLDVNGAAGANHLKFDLGSNSVDLLTVAGATSIATSGAAVIDLNQIGGALTPIAAGTYTLIQGGGAMVAVNRFSLATTTLFGSTFTLSVVGNDLRLTAAAGFTGAGSAVWRGGSDSWSAAGNWNTDTSSGVALGSVPGIGTNVTFATTSPTPNNLTTNLVDADFEINSLTFNSATGGVAIGGGKTLTLDATNANGNTSGNGIRSLNTSGTNTIDAKVGLGGSQTWTVSGGGTLAVSGLVSDFGGNFALTKAGAGTLILSGANTYGGATVISDGVLNVQSATGLGSTAAGTTVSSGAALEIQGSINIGAEALALSGTGIAGNGALRNVSGTNDYAGLITLNSDARIQSDIGTLTLSHVGTITGAGYDLTVGGAGNTVIASVIGTGAGDLVKDGAGTLTLSGANTYTGTTRITGGAVSIGNTAAIATSAGVEMANGAALEYTGSDATLDRDITVTSGTGTLRNLGGGLLTLSGTLDKDGTTLQFDQGAFVVTGTIIGASAHSDLIVNNATVTLAAANTYNGPTYLRSGGVLNANVSGALPIAKRTHLVMDDSGSGGSQLNLGASQAVAALSGATSSRVNLGANTLTVGTSTNTDGNFAGSISGTGGFIKDGSNSQTLSGANTFTGGTTITAGALVVAHANALGRGNVQVTGGTLKMSGNPVRAVVTGNYTQGGSGTLALRTRPNTASDQLIIGGRAQLGGTLRLITSGNVSLLDGQQIDLVTAAGGISGAFSRVVENLETGTLIEANVVFGSNKIMLVGEMGSATDLLKDNLTPSQKATARALDQTFANGGSEPLRQILSTLPLAGVPAALDAIAPEELTAIYQHAFASSRAQNNNIEQRLREVRAGWNGSSTANLRGALADRIEDGLHSAANFDQRLEEIAERNAKEIATIGEPRQWSFFASGDAQLLSIDSTVAAKGFDLQTEGVTVGGDYRVNDHMVVGLTSGYARSTGDLFGGGRFDITSGVKAAAYASCFGEGFYGNAIVGVGSNQYKIRRNGLGGDASGKTDGKEFNVQLSGGYDWHRGALTFGPDATLRYSLTNISGYKEHGSAAPLQIESQSAHSLQMEIGMHVSYAMKVGSMTLTPNARIAWQHEFLDGNPTIASRFASGDSGVFRVRGARLGADSIVIGGGASLQVNDAVSVYGIYNGEFLRTNSAVHQFNAGVRVEF